MIAIWRDATSADAERLAVLGRRSFIETFGHLYSRENLAAFLANHSPERWLAQLSDPAFCVRIGEADGAAMAYAKLGPPSLPFHTQRQAIELRQFYLLAPWHGTGAAGALMDWTLATARAAGAEELYLSVFVDNHRARRFYARYGFAEVGRHAFMVGSHADLDLVLRLGLESQRAMPEKA